MSRSDVIDVNIYDAQTATRFCGLCCVRGRRKVLCEAEVFGLLAALDTGCLFYRQSVPWGCHTR